MAQSSGSPGLQKQAMDTATKSMPWRKDVPWWVILIQALILAGLGLFILTNPSSAGAAVVLALGALMLVDGIMAVVGSLRGRHKGRANTFNAVNAGISIIVGVLVLAAFLFPGFLEVRTAAILAALGLIVTGGISAVLALFMRNPGEKIRWMRVIVPVVWIVLGVLVLVSLSDGNSFNPLPIVGWAALILGIILAVLTYFRFQASRKEEAVAAVTPAPTPIAPSAAAPTPKPAAPAAAAPQPVAPAPEPAAPKPPASSPPPANPS